MSVIKTYKGKLAIGEQEKIHLSNNDGLLGYRISKFELIPNKFNVANKLVAKVFLTDQSGNINAEIDFNDTDILAVAYYEDAAGSSGSGNPNKVVFDKETFNQDIFVYITDVDGGTTPANYYIELEQFKLDLNTSTYHTLKNIRSLTGPGFEFL
tara:strand:- start:49 stop:510 length:462 start_codon:yes stop_codon:yes gene_type:complete